MNKSYGHLTLDKQTKNILSGTKKYKRENVTLKMFLLILISFKRY